MIQILEASFFILEIAPRDHYHGLVSEFMIKSAESKTSMRVSI